MSTSREPIDASSQPDGAPSPPAGAAASSDAVELRFFVVRELPLVVAGVPRSGRGAALTSALAERGLDPLPGFMGVELPRGARVGFVLDADELRLVDDRDDTLLRAPRGDIDPSWIASARRLKGTMAVVADRLDVAPEAPAASVARAVDARARAGGALGAVVGVIEERPRLPLVF